MDDLKNIIESLLFVSDEPLSLQQFKRIIPEVDTRQIRQAMVDLAADYDSRQTSFHLDEVAGGYQLRTRPAYTEWISRLVQPKPARLSKAALETLAITAYKQPVLRADIEHIRGVDCGGTLRLLMERNLIRILGRKEIPGRPLIYATTKLFLEIFGLKDLKELPTPAEIESLGKNEDPVNGNMDTDRPHPPEPAQTIPEKPDNAQSSGQRQSLENSQAKPPSGAELEKKPIVSDVSEQHQDDTITPSNEKDLDVDSREDYRKDDPSETGG